MVICTQNDNQPWIWIALCRFTRQVVAYYIGDRNAENCRELWKHIPEVYKTCVTFSDFWDAYQKVFTFGTHHSVDKESGQTAYVERWNNTLGQRIACFVRNSVSFSKSDVFHEVALKIFLHFYNLEHLLAKI